MDTQTLPVKPPAAVIAKLAADGDGAQIRQYLTFQLAGEMYALRILNVKEIIEYGSLTEVPMMPEAVRGVINLRGAVVPVIDLSARFGRQPTVVGRRTCIVIVELDQNGERADVGLIVDAVNEVIDINAGEIEPAPSFGAKIRTDFIGGMGKVNGQFVTILDVGKVLSLEDLEILHAVDEGDTGTGPQRH